VPKISSPKRVCGFTTEAIERLHRQERLEQVLGGKPLVWVYAVVDVAAGAVKIGQSKRHPKLRLDSGQTFNPNVLKLLGYTGHITEQLCHRRLWRYHLRGEWFRLCPAVVSYVSDHFDYIDASVLRELR
jgi:hypothetical protein